MAAVFMCGRYCKSDEYGTQELKKGSWAIAMLINSSFSEFHIKTLIYQLAVW
jgi:hypothetical protein